MDYMLDDEYELDQFLKLYGTPSTGLMPRAKARQLIGDARKGFIRIATDLRDYAWNKQIAMNQRKAGDIGTAISYENICESIYQRLPEDIRW